MWKITIDQLQNATLDDKDYIQKEFVLEPEDQNKKTLHELF